MSYDMNLEGFDKKLVADILHEYQTLMEGREEMSSKEFFDVRNYAKARTNLKKPESELTESQRIWKEFYLMSDDALTEHLGADQKINIDKLESQMEELELLGDKISFLQPLGREIEKMLIKQRVYLFVHSDKDEPTAYRIRKQELEDIMFDEKTPEELKFESAKQIINLVGLYKESFINDLRTLNDQLQKKLAVFEREIKLVPKQSEHEMELMRMDFLEWIRLAKEQLLGRIQATNSILNQIDLDKFLPLQVVEDGGSTSKNLTTEETEQFAKQMVTSAMLWDQANKVEEKISQKKDPITRRLLGDDIEDELAREYNEQSTSPPSDQNQSSPYFENNLGYRIAKVLYVSAWIMGFLFVVLLGFAYQSFISFIVGIFLLWGILALVRRGFLYIISGK